MNLTRFTRNTSAAVVAGVAAVASYSHMRDLAAAHGQSELLANLMPISVDGMLIVSTVVMADDRAAGRAPRMSAKVSFVIGVAASIVANVLAAPDNALARTISAWPAIALLLVVEMLSRTGRPRDTHAPVVSPEMPASAPVPVVTPDALVSSPRRTPRRKAGRKSAADRVAAAARRTPQATAAMLAGRLGLSERTVQRHLDVLSVDKMRPPQPTPAQANGHVPALDEREEVPA